MREQAYVGFPVTYGFPAGVEAKTNTTLAKYQSWLYANCLDWRWHRGKYDEIRGVNLDEDDAVYFKLKFGL